MSKILCPLDLNVPPDTNRWLWILPLQVTLLTIWLSFQILKIAWKNWVILNNILKHCIYDTQNEQDGLNLSCVFDNQKEEKKRKIPIEKWMPSLLFWCFKVWFQVKCLTTLLFHHSPPNNRLTLCVQIFHPFTLQPVIKMFWLGFCSGMQGQADSWTAATRVKLWSAE